jgi:hypothetical protein
MYEKEVIIIQKYIRRFLVRKRILIPDSYYQTKIWRKCKYWYKNGKSNECEKYQINMIEKIINNKLKKTDDRINILKNKIESKKSPMIGDDGYEWTENFDGKLIKDNKTYYFNLKFICDRGGAQTRTLREVYHFIKNQMECLIRLNINNLYFINILDGDTSYNNMNKFNFLLNKIEYYEVKKYVFIGSLYEFQKNNLSYKIKN